MKLELEVSPDASDSIDQIIKCTDLKSAGAVLQSGLTLLRIHIQAAQEGKAIAIMEGGLGGCRDISLPFKVRRN